MYFPFSSTKVTNNMQRGGKSPVKRCKDGAKNGQKAIFL